jgi:hypothetical protein
MFLGGVLALSVAGCFGYILYRWLRDYYSEKKKSDALQVDTEIPKTAKTDLEAANTAINF